MQLLVIIHVVSQYQNLPNKSIKISFIRCKNIKWDNIHDETESSLLFAERRSNFESSLLKVLYVFLKQNTNIEFAVENPTNLQKPTICNKILTKLKLKPKNKEFTLGLKETCSFRHVNVDPTTLRNSWIGVIIDGLHPFLLYYIKLKLKRKKTY